MCDKYEMNKNGVTISNSNNTGDFKRNTSCSIHEDRERDRDMDREYQEHEQGQEAGLAGEKAAEYMRELLAEKLHIDQDKFPIAVRLIDQELPLAEVSRVQALGRVPLKETRYVDIYREKPIKVSVKVLVPVHEHPKFNFVGKLLGPKGNSMKRLQEETMCKMAVLGRGSMKDRQKEEELRQALDPKYAHLCDDLHVEISALGPPAEAHARIAFALAEVRKYLIPDNNDNIRQEQIRELLDPASPQAFPPADPAALRGRGRAGFKPASRTVASTARSPLPTPRVMPAKTKIMSILDRARMAMEETYGYEEPYEDAPPNHLEDATIYHSRHSHHYVYGEPSVHHHRHESYYDGTTTVSAATEYHYPSRHHAIEHEYGGSSSSHHHQRPYKSITSSRSESHSIIRSTPSATRETRYRSSPYTRPSK